jgi:iron only hydrogenase large subunit-like protein
VIQYSPFVPYALAEELGVKYHRDFDRLLNAALRKTGFEKVFLSGAGTDILVTELTDAIIASKESAGKRSLIVSACPAWVKYCEQFHPDILTMFSSLKTPQQITGAIIKSVLPAAGDAAGVYTVSVTPCTAMKFEARRESMTRKGVSDIDTVLTVRELARLVVLYGIDITNIDPEPADEPLSNRSSAALMAETTGGITESVLRALTVRSGGKEADKAAVKRIRTNSSFREAMITEGGVTYSVAVVDGLKGFNRLREMLDRGTVYDMVEVMACPGGCINGGGIVPAVSKEAVRQRSRLIYAADEQDAVRCPENSATVSALYDSTFRENPVLADREPFHTAFSRRDVML